MSSSAKLLLSLLLVVLAADVTRALRIANTFSYADTPSPAPVSPLPVMWYELLDNSTSPGNTRFEKEIGRIYGIEALVTANEFVLKTLNQKPGEGKSYSLVVLVVESFEQAGIGSYPDAVASTIDSNIRLNADYLQGYYGDVKSEFTGILYHESTHVWQWTGQGSTPIGLINGIADYVRLTAGWPASDWGMRGSGYRWDEGYEVTAYFLEYCEGMMEGFVSKLNAMMKDYYSEDFFIVLLGKSVDELWSEYKLVYACPGPSPVPMSG